MIYLISILMLVDDGLFANRIKYDNEGSKRTSSLKLGHASKKFGKHCSKANSKYFVYGL